MLNVKWMKILRIRYDTKYLKNTIEKEFRLATWEGEIVGLVFVRAVTYVTYILCPLSFTRFLCRTRYRCVHIPFSYSFQITLWSFGTILSLLLSCYYSRGNTRARQTVSRIGAFPLSFPFSSLPVAYTKLKNFAPILQLL